MSAASGGNSLAIAKPHPAISIPVSAGNSIELTVEQVCTMLAPGASERDAIKFLLVAREMGLNPLTGEIHLAQIGGKYQPIPSKVGYLKRASNHPAFDGIEHGIIVREKFTDGRFGPIHEIVGSYRPPDHQLLGGWCKVFRKDRSKPAYSRIGLEEYDRKIGAWRTHPSTMAETVAIRHAVQEAFPSGESWSESELDAVNPVQRPLTAEPITVTRVPEPEPEPQSNPELKVHGIQFEDSDFDKFRKTKEFVSEPDNERHVLIRRMFLLCDLNESQICQVLTKRHAHRLEEITDDDELDFLIRSLIRYSRKNFPEREIPEAHFGQYLDEMASETSM